MRIGMILDKTFPPDPRVENEALTLIEAGHMIFLFSLSYDKKERQKVDYKGIKIRRYLSNKLTYKLSALAYTFPFYKWMLSSKIKNFILSNKIEVLHIHDMRIAGTVFKVNKKLNLPIVLDLHDNYPDVMKEYPHLKKFPGKYIISPKKWLLKEEKFIHKADRVISVSQEFVDNIKSRLNTHKEKVILVPNTVRKSFYTSFQLDKTILDKFKDDFVLLYIGDTGLRRGLQIAITALPDIQKEIKNIKLVIVGKSSTDIILQKQISDLQIEKLVTFEGWQSPETFPSYIKAANIGISPLIRSKQHDMAYANKLFQYMSLGLPVLVSDAIAQKRIVEKNKTGLVHKNNDSVDFAKKVIVLYTEKQAYKEYAKNAENFIKENFHWEFTSEELRKLYKDL